MQYITDLHIHSRFSRAVSKQMTLPAIAGWAAKKGIHIVATGDWTHPMWYREIQRDLKELGNGLLKLRKVDSNDGMDPFFLLSTEISCIYSQNGKGRRIHIVVFMPSLESVRKVNQELTKRGCNLLSDGRPIIGLSARDLTESILSQEPKAMVIPAHIWTPWFSMYGSMSGFATIDEAFGPWAKHIHAVETGLSSSPDMNWRVGELDSRAIVSFSDAHSGAKLGREATVFDIPDGKVSYEEIYQAITQTAACSGEASVKGATQGSSSTVHPSNPISSTPLTLSDKDVTVLEKTRPAAPKALLNTSATSIAYTIEFYPEEGKYHYTGHRVCGIRLEPSDIASKGTTCSVCGKPLTQGVMQRVEELAERSEADLAISNIKYQISNKNAITMIKSGAFPGRPPFVKLVPLAEIISECIGSPVTSPKIEKYYEALTSKLGGEFGVLLNASLDEIRKVVGDRIAEGIAKVRDGDIVVDPGYDGVFGVVKIWKEGEGKPVVDNSKEQLSMFTK